jgi:hypothetical protein
MGNAGASVGRMHIPEAPLHLLAAAILGGLCLFSDLLSHGLLGKLRGVRTGLERRRPSSELL